ncbi:MAG: LytTR family DNA-binding domain-containing protein [Clostridioides sp.]|jgi:DNA-binding LytR/AlgR family response regulator|nr:LytTR family DNA-binding domain-containing protein [Clostridioides sp.]
MCKIIICDDEYNYIKQLRTFLDEFSNSSNIKFYIEEYFSGEELLNNLSIVKKSDLIFLDIEMEGISGMDVAKKLRENYIFNQIFFFTNYPSYINKVYQVEPYKFFLKSITYDDFKNIISSYVSKNINYITVNYNKTNKKIHKQDIYLVQVFNKKLTFHTKQGEHFTINGSLSHYSDKLVEPYFFRANKNDLINLKYISYINDTDNSVIIYDRIIHISRGKMTHLKSLLMNIC